GRRRHTRFSRDWSSDVCSSDLVPSLRGVVHSKTAIAYVATPRRSSMKLSVRLVAAAAVLAAAVACAPQTSGNSASDKDERTGTLRVWLFQEVNNKPKQQVVDSVVAGFEKAHEGAEVTVEYIPVETRAQRIKAAFNDPSSAPDLIEYGNTDTAGYVKDGGLADVSKEFAAWDEAKDTDPTARQSVTVDGKVYGAPYF